MNLNEIDGYDEDEDDEVLARMHAAVIMGRGGVNFSGGAEIIGGVSVGAQGAAGTIYSGFQLTWGDDFNVRPPTWSGANTGGKYSSSPPHIGFRRVQAAAADNMIYIEPGYRGNRSQSPTDLGFDACSVSSSVLSITPQAIPAGLSAFLPTTYSQGGGDGSNKPQLISGGLRTWPTFMVSADGDFIIEGLVKFPSGVARGFWPAIWTTALNWPDYGEIDAFEGKKDSSGIISLLTTLHVSNTDGAGDIFNTFSTVTPVLTSRFVQYACVKQGATISLYHDIAAQGTLALVASYSDARVSDRVRGAHDIRIEQAVAQNWDSSTFTAGDWPKTTQFDWVRVWCPSGTPANAAAVQLTPINTTPGGAWTATVPSNSALFGGTSPDIVEVCAAFDNEDTPGMPTRANRLPGGMTVDMSGRTISGTVPTTEGGRVGVLFLGSFSAGGPVKRALQYFNVAPAAQATLFTDQNVSSGNAVSLTVNFTDFHSGNLGPHTYVVTKTAGGTDFTISGNGTGTVTITGTDVTNETTTLSIACTNILGQTTTVTRNITQAAAFSPATWGSAIEWWDASDASTVFSDSAATVPAVVDTDKARAIVGKKLGAVLSNATSTITSPAYITDSIHGKKAIKFTKANVTRVATSNATVAGLATGTAKAYAVLTAVRRGTNAVSVSPFNYSRTTTQADYIRHFFGGADAVGIQRVINGTATTAQSANTQVTSDVWDVVLFHYNGTQLNIRLNGTSILSNGALSNGALTVDQFEWGAIFIQTTGWDGTLAFDGAIGEQILIAGGVALNDATLASAEGYLIGKWV